MVSKLSRRLPKTEQDIDVIDKRVLVRLDVDVPVAPVTRDKRQETRILDDTRLLNALPTVQHLLDRKAKVTIIGHLGRPGGKVVDAWRLQPVAQWYEDHLPKGAEVDLLENLRFEAGEEGNSLDFARYVVEHTQAQVYAFDAFAVSHREHASVVRIPKLLPTLVGLHFEKELVHLDKVLKNPRRPLVFVIGGAKVETKRPLIKKLGEIADEMLLGGALVKSEKFKVTCPQSLRSKRCRREGCSSKLKVAGLRRDGLDITERSAGEFAEVIRQAGTVVWNGPMGAFEKAQINKKTNKQKNKLGEDLKGTSAWGTYVIAKAVNETKAYTVIGGGDTEAAATRFGAEDGIDWVSSGGGAMLHFLAYGTLPFLEAVDRVSDV